MKEGTERTVAQKRGIRTQMLAEAEAPCAEQAGGAQWFYLSFQCWHSLISFWPVSWDRRVECDAAGAVGNLKGDRRWKTEGAGPNDQAVLIP